jgi:P-type Cu2+ transporter
MSTAFEESSSPLTTSTAPGAPNRVPPTTEGACHCAHCHAEVSSPPEIVFEQKAFCCHGCCAAYQWLTAEGLDQYYELRERFQASGGLRGAEVSIDEMSEFDSAWYAQQHIRPVAGNCLQTKIYLEGIHCAACVWLLEKMPKLVPGVLSAQVSLARSTVELMWDPAKVSLSRIAVEITRLGYRPHPIRGEAKFEQRTKALRRQLAQVGIAFACSGNSMLLAAALYLGEFYGMTAEHIQLLRGASTVVGLVALLGPGWTFFKGAFSAIRTKTPHIDVPVAIALAVGAASGIWNTLKGSGELYYDSLSMLVFLLLAGRYIQSRQQQSAYDSLDILLQLTPRKARLVRDGKVEMVASESLQVSDTFEVLEGESFAADGVVIQGRTEVDQALLTGETLPTVVNSGDLVFAGTINRGSAIRVRAEQVGENSRVGKLAATIEKAAVLRTPLVQLADRLAGRFVILVIFVAIATATYCYYYRPEAMIDRVVSLLIVACPCALGLATPMAVSLALGEAARRGILIRGGDALQRLADGGTILLDKTGTVTSGNVQVRFNDLPIEHWNAVIALEQKSSHPIAFAISNFWKENIQPSFSQQLPDVENVQYRSGGGIHGIVDGSSWWIGNAHFLETENIAIPQAFSQITTGYIDSGCSPVFVAHNGVIVGSLGVGDQLRPEVKPIVQKLKHEGWRIGLLSGDHPHIVAAMGDQLGLDADLVWGGQSPEDKQKIVAMLQQKKQVVVMVGDGVNDSVALAQADVGVAVKGGAEISLQAASVYLKNADLSALLDLAQAGRNTIRAIRRNFFASISYNIFAVGLAVLGLIHPLIAAGLMPISSITVVAVTLASRVFPNQGKPESRQVETSHSVKAIGSIIK